MGARAQMNAFAEMNAQAEMDPRVDCSSSRTCSRTHEQRRALAERRLVEADDRVQRFQMQARAQDWVHDRVQSPARARAASAEAFPGARAVAKSRANT
eukprot:5651144-Pleurochrysis_carterae.AAC.6